MLEAVNFPKNFFSKRGFDSDFIYNVRDDRPPNLWVAWQRGVSKPIVVASSDQQISMNVQWAETLFLFTVVHAKCVRAAQRDLWNDLVSVNPGLNVPWMVVGDFNATLASHEKRGPGVFNLGSVADLGAMVDACLLIKIPSQGRKFTWSNNRRRGNVAAVLDRSFCNDTWISTFLDLHQVVLQRVASDHSPVLVVSAASERLRNCPFRFQHFWTEHETFLHTVKRSWDEDIKGSPMVVFVEKLKRLKGVLRTWGKSSFPNFNVELEDAKKGLKDMQREIEEQGMSDEIFSWEANAKTRQLKPLENYKKLWTEKARIKWRLQGDRCSNFFHIFAKMRRIKHSIRMIRQKDGVVLVEKDQIEGYVTKVYENFHKDVPTHDHMELLECIPNSLEEDKRTGLDLTPSDEEIKGAVWDLDSESAPGPDGFPGTFYKVCWDIIATDVCKAINFFFRTDYLPYRINNFFFGIDSESEGSDFSG
ncbi:uncharacterized protein LOC122089746 [Macadamia integrifolia]|uniref:uncharacterized protein LOC122089746 n=1 Tax=Macadamia integrifolia TaxID=60698 RepID=UPI001C4F2539|nr:uncharacterized protein LOC122089746 [Macadamia integrifolia]